eukprot:717150-Amphidinium_carterae.3
MGMGHLAHLVGVAATFVAVVVYQGGIGVPFGFMVLTEVAYWVVPFYAGKQVAPAGSRRQEQGLATQHSTRCETGCECVSRNTVQGVKQAVSVCLFACVRYHAIP